MDCIYFYIKDSIWECSNCREWLDSKILKDDRVKYCPYCGAKIIGEKIETLEEMVGKIRQEDNNQTLRNIKRAKQAIKRMKDKNNMNNFPVGTKVKIITERKDFIFMYGKDNKETGVVIGNNGCEGCGVTVEIDKPRLIGTYNFDIDELEVIANIKLL